MNGPLKGIRVLDVSAGAVGPWAGTLLGALGGCGASGAGCWWLWWDSCQG